MGWDKLASTLQVFLQVFFKQQGILCVLKPISFDRSGVLLVLQAAGLDYLPWQCGSVPGNALKGSINQTAILWMIKADQHKIHVQN